MQRNEELDWVKQQKWFYEFSLPDGTRTECYLNEDVRKIHRTREKILRHYLQGLPEGYATSIDVSCHEGYFSTVLAGHFESVIGLDKNPGSIVKATRIARVLGQDRVRFVASPVEDWVAPEPADFVLCLGLVYHVENPVQILRKLASLARKAICLESQVLPFEVSGRVEDGYYLTQRSLKGLFGLCPDYPRSAEGGLTEFALVPSRDALEFLLRELGFGKIDFYQPAADDYEQFVRGSRVMLLAQKATAGN